MIGPPTNSARVNCHPMSTARITPSSTTRLVEAISKTMADGEAGPLSEQRPGQGHRGIGARGRGRPEPGGQGQGPGPVVTQAPDDGAPADDRLDHRRQHEPEDQGPQDLPGHRAADQQGVADGVEESHRPAAIGWPSLRCTGDLRVPHRSELAAAQARAAGCGETTAGSGGDLPSIVPGRGQCRGFLAGSSVC